METAYGLKTGPAMLHIQIVSPAHSRTSGVAGQPTRCTKCLASECHTKCAAQVGSRNDAKDQACRRACLCLGRLSKVVACRRQVGKAIGQLLADTEQSACCVPASMLDTPI
ncbi:unnamed protein product [Polarella glacialis]|uniref:Uncharacterized protein n=1 Tax=Polarella glacialis TaxID=89957 RepID=A0A813KTS3_POLGL|nr:unnamed protein product [Polarella glacialis]